MLFVAAVSADDFLASLFDYNQERPVEAFKQRTRKTEFTSKEVAHLLRDYVSIILVLITYYKDLMLGRIQLSEADFIRIWCSVFEYQSDNMNLFDSQYLPAFREGGADGLIRMAGNRLIERLYDDPSELSVAEFDTLKNVLMNDLAAILRIFDCKPEK